MTLESRNQAIEESKRLFYVALTRARDLLVLSAKDKQQKDTWFTWLEEAINKNDTMKSYLTEIEQPPKVRAFVDAAEEYAGPTEKIDRSIPMTFSVSEIMSYMNAPELFLEKHILKLDGAWLEESVEADESVSVENIDEKLSLEAADTAEVNITRPDVIGTIVHRICELLDKGYREQDAWREAISTHILPEEEDLYLKLVSPIIHTYQSLELGEPIQNEWGFVLELNGAQIIGEIDKIVHNAGVYEVIDLKTNRIHDNVDELIQYYQPQLYLYKMACESELRVTVSKMKLVFLRDRNQAVYEVDFDPEYETQVLEAVEKVAELKWKYIIR